MRAPLFVSLVLLVTGAAALARAEEDPPRIYRWIDENGVAHYTTDLERVPEELRDQPLRREAVSAQAPAAVDAWVEQERIPEAPAPGATATDDRLTALNARIAELERAIAADEQLLKGDLIDAEAPASNELLEQVASRMPARIAELKKLQAERDALTQPGSEQ